MRRLCTALVALALLLPVAPLSAQQSPTPLTLDEVLALAAESAPRIAVADARVAESETAIVGARTLWQPQVDITGVYTLNDEETTVSFPNPLGALAPYLFAAVEANPALPDPTPFVSAPGTELTTQLRHDVRAIATVAQPLWQPYSAPARRRALLAVDAASAGRALAAWEIGDAAQTLFFDALRYDALAEAAGRNLELARLAEERAASALALGAGSELERDRAAVTRLGVEQQVRSALAGRDAVRDALSTLVGAEGPIAPVLPAPVDASTLGGEVAAGHPSVAFSEAQADFVQSELGTVRAGAIPVVVATGTVVAHRETTFAPDAVDWSVQVAARWSVYDGGSRRAERERIDAGAVSALSEGDAALAEAQGELNRAWIGYHDAVARNELAVEEVALAERAQASAESAFAIGAASRLDVDTAVERANGARLQRAVAEVDVLAAGHEVARLAGGTR
jgi:outer membrane protein TolC